MSQTCTECRVPISTGSKTGYCIKCSRKHFPPWNKGKKEDRPDVLEKMSLSRLGTAPANKGKNLSLEQRVKLSCINRNISTEEFDDFVTEASKRERNKFNDMELNLQCFNRDSFRCDRCNIDGAFLNAHHMNSWKHFPEQRFELSNLISLCYSCHKNFHGKYGNGKSEPNTQEQYAQYKASYVSTPKKTVYLVAGVSGSGKSWVCSNFKDLYVEFDTVPNKHARSIIHNHQSNMVLFDPTVHVSTFMKRNSDIFNIKLLVIQEPKEVIVSRLLSRQGKETPGLPRRMKRMATLARAAVFTGSSAEVLAYLLREVDVARVR